MNDLAAAPTLQRFTGPLPGFREARAISVMALMAGAILCALSLYYGINGQRFMGRPLGGDFGAFYVEGKILNGYAPERIYDIALQVELYCKYVPGSSNTEMLVYAHAPFLAVLFRPVALLPYTCAYVAWLAVSLILYVTALTLLFRATVPPRYHRTAYLLALSFPPFLFETWIGGQVSVLGFLAVAAALFLLWREWPFVAGLVLALATFKPTLLILPGLMLLVGRRWRMVSGFTCGIAGVLTVSWVAVGTAGFRAWFQALTFFRHITTSAEPVLRQHKYVDLNSFLSLVLGNGTAANQIVLFVAAASAVLLLGAAWWRSCNWATESKNLLWAATFSWSMVVNLYVPIYDTLMLVAAFALCSHVAARGTASERNTFASWLLVLYLSSWLTQVFAEFLHVQLFTGLLAGFGAYALRQAGRRCAAEPWLPYPAA